ncbi:hypothetical protein JR316_0011742 [Psilocybe cubensis]|uniref:Uncharacterized protein n=2 Tax=Psilocybe cubensis TaxID=181762 RepID=A0A8H8CJV8_PSICU|nr:hypothetical protein JR316_0011742 [Psilocybe cubensis]KAH9476171.1 hypothetical protein JR316_0011742 [Psilocybe cubensis]
MYSDAERAFWIQEAIAEVTATTSLHYLKHLYNTANVFLGLVPASEFRELSTNANLLKVVIETKDSAHQTQYQLTTDLTNTIGRLTNHIAVLHKSLEDVDAKQKFIEDNVAVMMRRDPNVAEFLAAYMILDADTSLLAVPLKEEVIQLRRKRQELLHNSPLPDIRVQPASNPATPEYDREVPHQAGTKDASHSLHAPRSDRDAFPIDFDELDSSVPKLVPSSPTDSDSSPPSPNYILSSVPDPTDEGAGPNHQGQHIINNSNYRDPVYRPRALYPGSSNSSTVRFQIPESHEQADQESLITAPNSPAITEADSMATSLIGLLRTPVHEEERTRFDLASRLTSPNPSTINDCSADADVLSYEAFVSSLGRRMSSTPPPSPQSGAEEEEDTGDRAHVTGSDASTVSARTQSGDGAASEAGSARSSSDTLLRAQGARASGAGNVQTSHALVRSRSTPSLRHSSSASSSSSALPSVPDFVMLRSHRRLTRIATVLMEVLIHCITGPAGDLDWQKIESSIHEGILEGDMRVTRRVLGSTARDGMDASQSLQDALPGSLLAVDGDAQPGSPLGSAPASDSSARSLSPDAHAPERPWTPS